MCENLLEDIDKSLTVSNLYVTFEQLSLKNQGVRAVLRDVCR